MILAIETSTSFGSVAITEEGKTKSLSIINIKNLHAEKIVFLIDQVLKNINHRIDKIKAIAISIGPGSFTGLRVGLSVAKGLCYSSGKPLIAVPTLDALALKSLEICKILKRYFIKDEIYVCPILNAKQNDFYYSFYKFSESELERIDDYSVGDIESINQKIYNTTLFLGDGVDIVREKINNQKAIILSDEFSYPDASYVGKIAERKYLNKEFTDIVSIEPIYVKEFSIKTK
ncbi:MAG: tRNA (adenosine(37)-N6)-threonylcarbamoyltransferase complex dimerization subunit type 1 TsaB [Candidatus Kryptonium sp.]|nr:tRNA (adenosine(37)-N6)-threonylcarbamoyltransferase complex dimerization subunit type 1 TsaB [Candidatus Kryptonium sp.]MCX7763257.1 tRNA (adenosine(37)-N6)-threonylcarbamoyltransferase complex dimerization subunit type 1 TsaB [Candidatus Kryptonium sp.]MDW8109144.1 tRNA (adenosine(37)-N6)-threonylcarbamoyltransferase complex dimerization subunit type 1 TsaB [Candidatus Kryptonium sp.]